MMAVDDPGVECELCGDEVPFSKYECHAMNHCQMREIKCRYCGEKYPRSIIGDHAQMCEGEEQK